LTINSFTSVSCEPPLVLVCIDYRAAALPHFRANPYYGINVLCDSQRNVSVRFSERQDERFDGIEWHRGITGAPLLGGCLASFECCVSQTVEAGDHAILIAEVLRAENRDGEPLIYWGSRYRHLLP
jgi:flavin reductase (DIM6/NTAB) family NADH-FMN oxidoreductase RutF